MDNTDDGSDVIEINAEEDEVNFARVNLFLAVFIPLLIVSAKIIPMLSVRISKLFFRPTAKEKELVKTARELKKEMSSMSMVDEFAAYAKIQRRLNQINLDLEATVGCRSSMQAQVNQIVKVICHIIVAVITATTVYMYRSIPVFIVPGNWFVPISTLLAYPTGIPGAISIISWIFLVRNILNVLLPPVSAQ